MVMVEAMAAVEVKGLEVVVETVAEDLAKEMLVMVVMAVVEVMVVAGMDLVVAVVKVGSVD